MASTSDRLTARDEVRRWPSCMVLSRGFDLLLSPFLHHEEMDPQQEREE